MPITSSEPVARPPTVATKLLIPPKPRHLIERRRLLDILDEGIQEGLVLLSAPAGAGKTVLLSSWIAAGRLPGPACWLSLDGEHNDACRLLEDLLNALRGSELIEPGSTLDRLKPPVGAHTERFLALLVNGLAELDSPLLLVLDEIHELTSPRSTAAIDFLVRYAPEQLRIVLAGRADPPLPIERLRVGNALTELRTADLAFDRGETADLCHRLDLHLSSAEIDLLWTRTEGWTAALRLAAFSLHGHPEPGRFLSEFAGTDRAVADYLVSEVLAGLPEDWREFMLRTCLVDTVSPELADALTGLEGATLTLAAIERLGAPVQATDAEGPWYRYHPLFGELLRAHLRHAHPEEVPLLHRRAARWYAERGEVMPAIRHALAGEDWEQAGGLIAENWLDLFLCGRSAAMRGPMAQLPAGVVAADPRLAAAFAGSRLQDGDLQDAERHLAIARHARGEVAAAAREPLEMTLATVALYDARLRVNLKDAERLSRRLTGMARHSPHHCWASLRSFALANLGATRLWTGDPVAAAAHLQEALALATEDRHEQIALDCLAQLAIVHLLSGELTRAERLGSQAVGLAEQRGWCEGPAAACAYLSCAASAYQRGEFEHAEGLLDRAAAAADTAEAPVRLATGLLQALTLAAAGPRSAARGALKLRAIRAELADGGDPVSEPLQIALEDVEPRVLMATGDLEQARATLAGAREREPQRPELLVHEASVELRAGELEQAARSLEQVLPAPGSTASGPAALKPTALGPTAPGPARAGQADNIHPATLLEAWLLQALVDQASGEQRAASQALDRALALAEREAFRDAFLLNGPAVRELLELQARTGTAHPALLEVLLDGVAQHTSSGEATLAEPLTEREQRILRYLPTMLSNAEIGAEMFVSLNTVKTHLRNIYRKLDASGRVDAVDRARRLGLLPAGIKRPRVVQRVSER
jgi:LuxR family transcriptional regulator, maltose regulon positive regulatory protein